MGATFFTWDNLSHMADMLGVITALPLLATSAYLLSRAQRYRWCQDTFSKVASNLSFM